MSHPSNNKRNICAGFFVRLVAYGIDCALFGILWSILFGFSSFSKAAVFFQFTLEDVLYYGLRTILFAICLTKMGATPGKSIMKLRVVSGDGTSISFGKALYRESVGRYLSEVIACLGYITILFHDEKQALHDMIAETRVVFKDADVSCFAPDEEEIKDEENADAAFYFEELDENSDFVPRSTGKTNTTETTEPASEQEDDSTQDADTEQDDTDTES